MKYFFVTFINDYDLMGNSIVSSENNLFSIKEFIKENKTVLSWKTISKAQYELFVKEYYESET